MADMSNYSGISLTPDTSNIKYINTGEKLLCTEEGNAEVYVTDDTVFISNQDIGVTVGANGTYIQGPLSLSAAPADIRINGNWVLNEELLTTLPSTLFNPVQTLLYKDPPYARNAYLLLSILAPLI